LALFVAVSIANPAAAMTLSVIGGDTTQDIPADFDLTAETLLAIGSDLTVFNSGNDGGGVGLQLDSAATLTYTLLGSEAGNKNVLHSLAGLGASVLGPLFDNGDPDGTFATVSYTSGGFLPFFVGTDGPVTATNAGTINGALSIAYAGLNVAGVNEVILLFGDGAGDSDFDDLAVRIAVNPVPLPAAVWLFLSAILGLVSFTRIRRDQKVA
jgi:hypothetical protein